ncbi:MAG TPA: SDR family NAD(P)-dependent oxidoreductase [Bryobacteraceae bacterium]|nr:SDR family NAD(P)-dependent oxidoreductase [Bryobacteraceae bacterium]
MTRKLEGHVAIVTGASKGIGRAIALRLAQDGVCVAVCARDSESLNDVVREIESNGGKAAACALDLRMPENPAKLAAFAVAMFGAIHIVVNNAGATKRGEFEALTEEDWADGFALKFFGSVRLARASWPHLKAVRGSLIFISGVGGRTPGAEFAIGGSVNAALLSLTKSLAETGLRDGVRVNAISPGTIRTARFQTRVEALAAERKIPVSEAEREYVKIHKIACIGEPSDVAALAAFIAGPEGRLFHGSLIDMDGGATKTI